MESSVHKPQDKGDAPALPELHGRVEDIGMLDAVHDHDMDGFWDACRPWLAWKGIDLYDLQLLNPAQVWRGKAWICPPSRSATTSAVALPYADSVKEVDDAPRFVKSMFNHKLAYARDRMGRDLILKLVDRGSDEHNINRLLLESTEPISPDGEAFPCALPPVAILDTPHEYSFIVMPMWGSPIHIDDLQSCGDILLFIRCLLRGLSFLHEHRIVHRDICDHNIVVSVGSPGAEHAKSRELLRQHRRDHEVLYALMDFDQSLLLPPDTSLEEFRLPAEESSFGNGMYKPTDNNLGQPFYNPFTFDVAMLGRVFQYHFTEAVTEMPGLAALFDRMTDHRIPRRLTARQALSFFDDDIASRLPRDVLKAPVTLKTSIDALYDTGTYWSKLTAADKSVWEKHRTPPQALLLRILDWMLSYPVCWRVVCALRSFLSF